ncbi:MAG TPA: hypothetical protein DEP18_07445 [Flavobacteriales bacterium]|nr:hypothetical protein [Flavobacteriales bacterium]HCA83607.1 hypothetical protein [Flavobacteriales bacterium]HRE73594.1 hypothetical protein [Flavobacteriales bacterium]HRE95351.1 hypothetical protein [Flavobacteriales bacterium]HRJ35134.1 hypothetical protein [Flavobacteriales bacterium]
MKPGKNVRNIFFLLVLPGFLMLFSCTAPEHEISENKTSDSLGQLLIDTALHFEEVKQLSLMLNKGHAGETQLSAIITARPSSAFDHYWIEIGESINGEFITYFHFLFFPEAEEWKVYDEKTDAVMDRSQWKTERMNAPLLQHKTPPPDRE